MSVVNFRTKIKHNNKYNRQTIKAKTQYRAVYEKDRPKKKIWPCKYG